MGSQALGLRLCELCFSYRFDHFFCVAQGSLELTGIYLSKSVSQVLGLKVCATTAWSLMTYLALHSDFQASFIC